MALGGISLSATSMFRMWTRWISEQPQLPPGQPPLISTFMAGLFISAATSRLTANNSILLILAEMLLMMVGGLAPIALIIALVRAHRSRSAG